MVALPELAGKHRLFEQGALCLKIGGVESTRRRAAREAWLFRLLERSAMEGRKEILRPRRSRSGKYMTAAVIHREDWLGPEDAPPDLAGIAARLRGYEEFLVRCLE